MPWHRIVRADGSLAKGARQRALLEAEGVPFRGRTRRHARFAAAGLKRHVAPLDPSLTLPIAGGARRLVATAWGER